MGINEIVNQMEIKVINQIKKAVNREMVYNNRRCLEYFNIVKSNDGSLNDDEIIKFTNELNDFNLKVAKCDFSNDTEVLNLCKLSIMMLTKYNCDPDIAAKFLAITEET